jgi:K+-sensing histidine kinase KdpD
LPRVTVVADVESNASALIERILKPAGIPAGIGEPPGGPGEVMIVDVTQLRGDPLAGLRARRLAGDEAPALLLAAHIPASRVRDLFRLGVADVLIKPYRPADLIQAVLAISESRSPEAHTQILSRRLEGVREESRRRSEEIRLLSDIGRTVAGLADLDDILARVTEAGAYMADAEEANLYLVDAETNELVLRASKQAGESRAILQRLRVTDTLVGQVFTSGKPMLRLPSPDDGPVKIATGFLAQSLIHVPVRLGHRTVGVMGVYNRQAPRPFAEHHMTLLVALADWAGIALERAALVQRARSPAPAAQQPPTTIITSSIDLTGGLKQALALVDELMAIAARAGSPGSEKLSQLKELVQSLTTIPIALLEPQQAGQLVDLTGIVYQTIEQLQPLASRQSIELSLTVDDPLPLFPGDPRRVQQVVRALTEAAIHRSTTHGRIKLRRFHFIARRGDVPGLRHPLHVQFMDGSWAGIEWVDSSPGLEPEVVRALSSARVDPSAGQIGPGLSMGEIRMIAESMDGQLWHERISSGAKIIFALPVKLEEVQQADETGLG